MGNMIEKKETKTDMARVDAWKGREGKAKRTSKTSGRRGNTTRI